MEILVNDKALNFEMEKILTLPEILENIRKWANQDNLFILDYRIDGFAHEMPEAQLTSENISKLEVLVGSRELLIWENIQELNKYISRLNSYLISKLQDSGIQGNINTEILIEGITWIYNSYDIIKQQFQNSVQEKYLLDELIEMIQKENYLTILDFTRIIGIEIELLKKKIFFIILNQEEANEIKDLYFSELAIVSDSLTKIASDLTLGKDRVALMALENIIEWLSIGLLVFEKTGTKSEVINSVKSSMVKLNEALEVKDFVSLADILDFDLKEALDSILSR